MRYTLDANAVTSSLPVARRENLLERVLDLELGAGEPLAIDVRAVGKQRQHARGAELGESVDVEVLAVDRRLIDLEVAGVHDRPRRRVNRQRDAIGHAVRHAQEFDFAVADRARADAAEPRTSRSPGSMPCSSSFGRRSASVSGVP